MKMDTDVDVALRDLHVKATNLLQRHFASVAKNTALMTPTTESAEPPPARQFTMMEGGAISSTFAPGSFAQPPDQNTFACAVTNDCGVTHNESVFGVPFPSSTSSRCQDTANAALSFLYRSTNPPLTTEERAVLHTLFEHAPLSSLRSLLVDLVDFVLTIGPASGSTSPSRSLGTPDALPPAQTLAAAVGDTGSVISSSLVMIHTQRRHSGGGYHLANGISPFGAKLELPSRPSRVEMFPPESLLASPNRVHKNSPSASSLIRKTTTKKLKIFRPTDTASTTHESAQSTPIVSPHLNIKATRVTDEQGFTTLNQYVLLDEAGEGRFGRVCVAAVEGSPELRAIKMISKAKLRNRWQQLHRLPMSDAPEVGGLHREVAIMKRIRHRNIVTLYEVIDDPNENFLYLVMQYVERGTIATVGDDGTCTPLELDMVRSVMRQAGDGLAYLHRHKIAHRDIKPDNILQGASGAVFLSDFGVSHIFDGGEGGDFVSETEGTPAFSAPESLSGEPGAKFSVTKADVWAFGVTMYVVLFGRLPFIAAGGYLDLCDKIRNQPISFDVTEQMAPGYDYTEAIDCVQWMLERDPAQRPTIHQVLRHSFFARSKAGAGQLTFDMVVSRSNETLDGGPAAMDVTMQPAALFSAGAAMPLMPLTPTTPFGHFHRYANRPQLVLQMPTDVEDEEVSPTEPTSDEIRASFSALHPKPPANWERSFSTVRRGW